MIARGNTREILKLVGKIQDLIGEARGLHWNDRDNTAYGKAQEKLDEALNLCFKITSKYNPI